MKEDGLVQVVTADGLRALIGLNVVITFDFYRSQDIDKVAMIIDGNEYRVKKEVLYNFWHSKVALKCEYVMLIGDAKYSNQDEYSLRDIVIRCFGSGILHLVHLQKGDLENDIISLAARTSFDEGLPPLNEVLVYPNDDEPSIFVFGEKGYVRVNDIICQIEKSQQYHEALIQSAKDRGIKEDDIMAVSSIAFSTKLLSGMDGFNRINGKEVKYNIITNTGEVTVDCSEYSATVSGRAIDQLRLIIILMAMTGGYIVGSGLGVSAVGVPLLWTGAIDIPLSDMDREIIVGVVSAVLAVALAAVFAGIAAKCNTGCCQRCTS